MSLQEFFTIASTWLILSESQHQQTDTFPLLFSISSFSVASNWPFCSLRSCNYNLPKLWRIYPDFKVTWLITLGVSAKALLPVILHEPPADNAYSSKILFSTVDFFLFFCTVDFCLYSRFCSMKYIFVIISKQPLQVFTSWYSFTQKQTLLIFFFNTV